ncbi:MAG: hypothetical protein LUQ26_09390 [Methylococcaceae bacterium]|nr:hypothetical protein [Methylococcaceae bacterium]
MLDFTLLGNCSCVALPPASMQVVTLALSNKRGSLVPLQLIVFIMRKSCVDTYTFLFGRRQSGFNPLPDQTSLEFSFMETNP